MKRLTRLISIGLGVTALVTFGTVADATIGVVHEDCVH